MIGYCDWLISSCWSISCHGDYPWKLVVVRIRVRARVIMKDKKYSLIRPFWLEMVTDDFTLRCETDFGSRYSSQIISISVEASFWLVDRFIVGTKR